MKKFWKKICEKKLIIIIIISLIIIAAVAFCFYKYKSKIFKPKEDNSVFIVPESWSKFSDGFAGIAVSYPSDWQVVRTPDSKTIKLYPPDKKQVLVLMLGKTEKEVLENQNGNFLREKSGRDGTLKIFGQDVQRDIVVIVGKTTEVYWAKKPIKITESKYLSAVLESVPSNVNSRDVDLKQLDCYKISQEILTSLK